MLSKNENYSLFVKNYSLLNGQIQLGKKRITDSVKTFQTLGRGTPAWASLGQAQIRYWTTQQVQFLVTRKE